MTIALEQLAQAMEQLAQALEKLAQALQQLGHQNVHKHLSTGNSRWSRDFIQRY